LCNISPFISVVIAILLLRRALV